MTNTETTLLAHQLQGIMECWDMSSLFFLLKINPLYKYHKNRLIKLLSNHHYINCMMIKRYKEIGEIPYEYSSNLKLPMKDTTNSTTIVNTYLDSWVKWATTLKDLYGQLVKDDKEYKTTWYKMYNQAQADLDIANKFHKRYYVVPRNVRLEMQAKLNAARNTSA